MWISFRKLPSLLINIFQEQITAKLQSWWRTVWWLTSFTPPICWNDLLELLPIYAWSLIFISFSNFFELKIGLHNTKNLWPFPFSSSFSEDIISGTSTDKKYFFVLESNNDSATWFWRLFFLLWAFWKINNYNDNNKIGEKIIIAEKTKASKAKVSDMSFVMTILFWVFIFIGAPKSYGLRVPRITLLGSWI